MKNIKAYLVMSIFLFSSALQAQWIEQTLPGDIVVTLGIDFFNQNHGITGGWEGDLSQQIFGEVYYTTNGGINWIEATLPDSMRVMVEVQMIDDMRAYGAGAYNQTLINNQSGSNFSLLNNPLLQSRSERLGMNFSRQEEYRGYFVETTDGGLTWHPKGSFEDSVYYLVGISFIDQQTGFVLASGPSANSSAILKTSDNGDSWSYVYSFETGLTINSIKFFNQLDGITVGTSDAIPGNIGIILRTTNGGNTWMRIELPLLATIDDVTYLDFNSILISGVKTDFSAVIFRTDDGGVTWFECCTYSDTHTISGINSLPASGVIIVYGQYQPIGSSIPFIEATINNGVSWYYDLLSQFTDYYLTKSKLVDESRWYITGTQFAQMGFVLFTDNAGGVPVELTSFSAEFIENQVSIRWTTASELNNMGFEVEQKSDDEDWRMIGFIEGKGTTTEKQTYSFTDDLFGVNNTKLNYRLKQIDFNGSYEYSDAVEVNIDIANPEIFFLSQNYPNPFNPSTKIKFTIPSVTLRQAQSDAWVTLKVYDVLGNEIATLVNEELSPGEYEVEFIGHSDEGQNLPSGIYFYQLRTKGPETSSGQGIIQAKKMVYLK
jgi:photosystem II stability/assembly factor-like uncharacterized protein